MNQLEQLVYDAVMNLWFMKRIDESGIEAAVDKLLPIYRDPCADEKADREQLTRKILEDIGVIQAPPSTMLGPEKHVEWLAEKRGSIYRNGYWSRYRAYLEKSVRLPPAVTAGIDVATDSILGLLEDPSRQGPWDRRGLVVGDVQSGKTGNYTGLMCKAADAGYKMLVVLAGITNDLRCQTQRRIDLGFIGMDTRLLNGSNGQGGRAIGVGMLPGHPQLRVHSITSAEADGDYRKSSTSVNVAAGGDPIVAVVKKNKAVLESLLKYFEAPWTSGVPLLLIDDEADNASVDTGRVRRKGTGDSAKDDAQNQTVINGLIRQILRRFERSAYVGYTATPFANSFISPRTEVGSATDKYGEDLFPRSFIVNLRAPSNYIGPVRLFGGGNEDDTADVIHRPLPLTRDADDAAEQFPSAHSKDHQVRELPQSLLGAMLDFILADAARACRGQGSKHHSMLVHVTRYVDVQRQVAELVSEHISNLRYDLMLRTGPRYERLIAELERRWQDFEATTRETADILGKPELQGPTWEQIEPRLYDCAAHVEVCEVNSTSADGGLHYENHAGGLHVIAVGGDKLSRGLTLEGLTVSYHARQASAYDTLLQMGRWFGYRDGYEDLCRLYVSSTVKEYYRCITAASEELRDEFDAMARSGGTPEDFGLRVRTHPDLQITAPGKMRHATEQEITYSGRLVQIDHYWRHDQCNQDNLESLDRWLRDRGSHQKRDGVSRYIFWSGVGPEAVAELLKHVKIHEQCRVRADPNNVIDYIREMNKRQELMDWTVALVNPREADNSRRPVTLEATGLKVGLTLRSDASPEDSDTIVLIRGNLITPMDQAADLSPVERDQAMAETLKAWEEKGQDEPEPVNPSPVQIRKSRPPQRGLLLIYLLNCGTRGGENEEWRAYDDVYVGYALSFPFSKEAATVKYRVNETYIRVLLDDDDQDDVLEHMWLEAESGIDVPGTAGMAWSIRSCRSGSTSVPGAVRPGACCASTSLKTDGPSWRQSDPRRASR